MVQSHISTKEIDDIMNDRDDDSNTASKSTSKSAKPAGGKAAPAKKGTAVRGKISIVESVINR